MGKQKVDPMSAKALSNRMKNKGLQKLKFYCQMCQKQCRDENGFKCHTMSESHQRQLLIFAEAPSKFLDQFSSEFFGGFMRVLKNQFGTQRVNANSVYQEYIRDKDHVHMNGTKWLSLGGFVRWLGAREHCEIEETPKGWFITYIDKDPETLRRNHVLRAKEKLDQDDQERMEKFLSKQIERNKHNRIEQPTIYSEFKRLSNNDTIKFNITKLNNKESNIIESESILENIVDINNIEDLNMASKEITTQINGSKPKSNLETLILDKFVGKRKRQDNWIVPSLIVKIITESLGNEFYKKKAVIKDVLDKYTAVVELLEDPNIKMKLDQTHMETVIPAIGKPLKIVNGEYRDEYGKLLKVDSKSFSVSIELISSIFKGKIINELPFEDVCKYATL